MQALFELDQNNSRELELFGEVLLHVAKDIYRDMPWRQDTRPYYVLVSELMLQQTQVSRVALKFDAFIQRFPDEYSLAASPLAEVVMQWQGLGYNRRAKYLHDAARMIVNEHSGVFPSDREAILRLPGVGINTTGAIEAYAFNRPSIFIETNIRTVYIHHFFDDESDIDDKQIIEKLRDTIDREHPREFYWALMDYGSWLKSNGLRINSRSKHYKKQSRLEGSIRQVRGAIIRALSANDATEAELRIMLGADDRFEPALDGLVRDGLVVRADSTLHLTK